MNQAEQKEYKDTDFLETTEYNLASYLLCKGHTLKGIEFKTRYAPQTGTFLFVKNENIDKDVESYWKNELVKIQDFINATRRLNHQLKYEMNKHGVYKYGLTKDI